MEVNAHTSYDVEREFNVIQLMISVGVSMNAVMTVEHMDQFPVADFNGPYTLSDRIGA